MNTKEKNMGEELNDGLQDVQNALLQVCLYLVYWNFYVGLWRPRKGEKDFKW
jgi:hypothetical protein